LDFKPGTLLGILKLAEVDKDEFIEKAKK